MKTKQCINCATPDLSINAVVCPSCGKCQDFIDENVNVNGLCENHEEKDEL